MFKMRFSLVLVSMPAVLVRAGRDTGRPGYGLVGYGIEMYIPVCAYACQYSFSSNQLVCTDEASFNGAGMGGMNMGSGQDGTALPKNVSAMPSSTCHAESEAFLTSVAWCIHEKCSDIPVWKIEKWWQSYVVGNMPTDPPPSLSYGEALSLVTESPKIACPKGQILNETSLVDEIGYKARYVSISVNQDVEVQHERFGLVILLSGVMIPVGFSLLRFLPFPKRWASALNGRFIYPSLFRPWRDSPVGAVVGDPPTRGQVLFIGYLILLNIFLSAFSYSVHPVAFGYWWNDSPDEVMGDLANRLGILSFANFALLVLYSSRNNMLLWLTNWPRSTFVLLHRWVARIAVLEAILHSVIFLRDWIMENRLEADQVLPYWWWGCIATIAASLLLPLSIPVMRQRSYELFLAIHVVFAILIFLGSWYHIIFRYEHQWGYETWLYVVFAVWGFDRLLRLLRMLRYGVRTARITVIDDDYVRINVKGVVGTGHVYLYFLDWRVWENHPFSIASSIIQQKDASPSKNESLADVEDIKTGQSTRKAVQSFDQTVETGMVFYVRLLSGGTKALRYKTELPVLIEGPYGTHGDLSDYPTLVCIAGGVGVTAVLPYMRAHSGNTFLYWGSRSQALVDSLKPLTHGLNIETTVGQRLALQDILESQHGDFAVVVSGPAGMMDEAREIASRIALQRRVKFIAESFIY
ncbi:ferric reductase like transmembrane component-domain-containing protein [Hypomontagnella submonticulosa]|nr:ferric reductase like transmembrane component-domain-containing protein [Hypomontagnella submonticulosa]